MMCGAENRTAMVATIVKNVKIIRHNLSTTIAANFQSFAISLSSSSFRIWGVKREREEKKEYLKEDAFLTSYFVILC